MYLYIKNEARTSDISNRILIISLLVFDRWIKKNMFDIWQRHDLKLHLLYHLNKILMKWKCINLSDD